MGTGLAPSRFGTYRGPALPLGYKYSYGIDPRGSTTTSNWYPEKDLYSGTGLSNNLSTAATDLPNDLFTRLQRLFETSSSSASAPMVQSTQQLAGLDYLSQIQALMKQLGGGLAPLTPQMQQEFAQRKQAMMNEINNTYARDMGQAVASMYDRGFERSGQAGNQYEDISGKKSGAISSLLSNLFNQEMTLRSGMAQEQNQGVMSQIGILGELMRNAQQNQMMQQQQGFQNQQAVAGDQRQQQMMLFQAIMELLQRFGGNNLNLSSILR